MTPSEHVTLARIAAALEKLVTLGEIEDARAVKRAQILEEQHRMAKEEHARAERFQNNILKQASAQTKNQETFIKAAVPPPEPWQRDSDEESNG